MTIAWKWQRPKQRKCKKGRTNIEQLHVWNSPDERLAELGTDKKTVAVNHGVVEPFEKNKGASHRDQSNGGCDEHLLPERRRAMARLFRRVPVGEIVDRDDGESARGQRLRDVTKKPQDRVKSPEPHRGKYQRSAATQRSDHTCDETARQGLWIGTCQDSRRQLAGIITCPHCSRHLRAPYPAQQDSFATSLANDCAASFNPSTVVR